MVEVTSTNLCPFGFTALLTLSDSGGVGGDGSLSCLLQGQTRDQIWPISTRHPLTEGLAQGWTCDLEDPIEISPGENR